MKLLKIKINNYLFIVLILLDVVLLIITISLNFERNNLLLKYNVLFLKYHNNFSEGSLLNPYYYKYKKIYFNEPNMKEVKKSLKIVALFSEKDCIECTEIEVKYLNILFKSFPKNLIVYIVGSNKNYLKSLGANFNFKEITKNEKDKIFSENIFYHTPLIFLIGPDDTIFDIHKPEPGVKIKTKIFYSKVYELFNHFFKK